MTYRCGHALQALPSSFEQNEAFLIRVAFTCPDCIAEITRRAVLDTRAYVNMQQISPGMAAFVIEVSQTHDELGKLLAAVGYVRRGKSLDELTPGIEVVEEDGCVWRKELWFATNTDPRHVVALIQHIKMETAWLGSYLPGEMAAVQYFSFPL
ncbi:hypothetical protein [Jeongeupia naejangsanensis]|uniref:Uncharacterized protein n=1 Tax=Jeongeupia naejangsanensis TaxID=613195 RepID=A0ABS2BMG8_9NEIS|nr:hypothetical protein [Jeongeupia naejangsanensis]MBM3116258.1 hypothetical protein [Jeongeupia naejangsanensis]